MTADEFDKKYEKYLEKGHYGLDINDPDVIEYLDKEFEAEIKENPDFNYAQIKLKFKMPRVYTSSSKNQIWEEQIDKILQSKHEVKDESR